MSEFLEVLDGVVGNIALFCAAIIEVLGIAVIVFGSIKSIVSLIMNHIKKNKKYNVKIDLGNFLALGLELKMGAEILKTVVIRTLDELLILGAIILLRAVLAVLIHWEIKNEKKPELKNEKNDLDFAKEDNKNE